MPSILPFPSRAQDQTRLVCPICGENPDQRIDTPGDTPAEIVASCICTSGHLFVINWRDGQ